MHQAAGHAASVTAAPRTEARLSSIRNTEVLDASEEPSLRHLKKQSMASSFHTPRGAVLGTFFSLHRKVLPQP